MLQFECSLNSEPTHSVVSFTKSSYCSSRLFSNRVWIFTDHPQSRSVKMEGDAETKWSFYLDCRMDLSINDTKRQTVILSLFMRTSVILIRNLYTHCPCGQRSTIIWGRWGGAKFKSSMELDSVIVRQYVILYSTWPSKIYLKKKQENFFHQIWSDRCSLLCNTFKSVRLNKNAM